MNYSRLHLYMGVTARGEFRKGKIVEYFNGPIGPSTLLKIEEFPQQYTVRPILIPASALTKELIEPMVQQILSAIPKVERHVCLGGLITIFRERGYDCDNLIAQGLAICHPDYDIKDLL